MKRTLLTKLMLLLCALVAGGGSVWAETTWTRVTSIQTLFEGGTFIMGYESTAKSGMIIPLRSKDCGAKTTANGFFYTGTTNGSSDHGTITMSNLSNVTTSNYEVYITGIKVNDVYTYINIQRTNSSGDYYGSSSEGSSSNTGRLYTTGSSNETNLKPAWASETNNQFKLTAAVNGSYKYLKYNTGSPRFAFYNSAGEKIVFYKKGESGPSITACNVNIAYNATSGSIGYSMTNANGNVTANVTSGDWLTSLGTITASEVPFNCSANTTTTARTATVTLSYTGATDKVVTITQAAAPYANIAALTANTEANTYNVTLSNAIVTFVSGNYAYIQDASGAVVLYKSSHGLTAGNVLNGTATVTYQLKNSNPQITDISGITPTTGAAPAPTAVAQSAWSYTFSNVLSQYLKITGATITQSNSKYYVSLGGENIQLYKASGSISSLDLTKKYNITGFPTLYNSTKEIQIFADPEEATDPTLSANPATAQAFTYIVGNGPSDDQMFTVTGANLGSADITAAVSSDYEITDNTDYSSSVTIASGDVVSVRLKSGLTKGTHNGTLTLSSTGATDVVINLSGTVTGQTYAITQYTAPATAHGTITFSPASPIEDGTEVTLTATPANGYAFTADSWVIYKESGNNYVVDNSITVTDGKITMPAYALYVDATFTAKPIYAITQNVTPASGGTITTDDNAWEDKEVTVLVEAASGYTFSSLTVAKSDDANTTVTTSGNATNGFTFTMPAYPVTVTATFLSNTFEGSFAKVTTTSALEDGGYYILYNTKAMNSTLSSGKMGFTDVTITNDIIENPNRSIVWKLVKNGDNWDLFNEKEGKYCYIEGTNTSAFKMATTASYHYVVTAYDTGGFKFKTTEQNGRGIDAGADNFGTYADSNNPTVYLYKYMTLTPRTITFNGNGGTYNTATTYTQDVYDGVEATLDANKFTRDGYEFMAWNTQADGLGADSYDDGDKITVTGGNLTLYAYWAPLYTLTIDNNIDGGSVGIEGNITSSVEGYNITLTATPTAGHKFSSWNVYKEGDPTTKLTVTNNVFNMPEYNVVISATFEEVQTYTLVTDVAQLVSGKHYIIASGTNGTVKAMGKQNDNNRSAVDVTATNGIIPETDGVYEFVIYGSDANGYYTIYDETNTKYLYAASSSSNYLKTRDANTDANGKWTIEIANTGVATIKAQGTYTRNWMRNNSSIFSCYGSGQSDIYLYEKDGEATPTIDVTLAASGYASYCSPMALDLTPTANYAAYAVTATSSSTVTFTKINGAVPAETPFILYGENYGGQTATLSAATGVTTAVTGNMLVGTLAPTAITTVSGDYTNFGLSGGSFVKINDGTLPANKAYLPVLTANLPSSSAPEFTIIFEDMQTTGINAVKGEGFTVNGYYDLQGRKVTNPTKGLYIVNGKKVIVK